MQTKQFSTQTKLVSFNLRVYAVPCSNHPPPPHYHQMFKPVRVVATIVFLAMIIMIFIAAFVIRSSTLCISKHTSVAIFVTLLKQGMQYSSCSSTLRSFGIRCRTFPTRALPSLDSSSLLNALIAYLPPHFPSVRRLFGLLIGHVVTSNLFCSGRLLLYIMLYEPQVIKLLTSVST